MKCPYTTPAVPCVIEEQKWNKKPILDFESMKIVILNFTNTFKLKFDLKQAY